MYTSIYHPIFMSSAPKKVPNKRRHGSIGEQVNEQSITHQLNKGAAPKPAEA